MTREEASGVLKAQADYYGKLFESMVTAGDYLELRELEKRMEALEMGADALRMSIAALNEVVSPTTQLDAVEAQLTELCRLANINIRVCNLLKTALALLDGGRK